MSYTTKSTTQSQHSAPGDRRQHRIIAFATSVLRSLLKSETVPEIISVSNTSTPPEFWWTTAFVQEGGTTSLSALNYIPIRVLKAKSWRPTVRASTWNRSSPRCQSYPRTFEPHRGCAGFIPETYAFQARCATGTAVNHVITAFRGRLINFISCINHDSLTFIVRLMGWSSGLGDSSLCDKCCYLSRARINRVCAQNGTGRVERKERGNLGTGQSHRDCCAPTNAGIHEDQCVLSTFSTNLSQNSLIWTTIPVLFLLKVYCH